MVIKVLIIEDSSFMRRVISDILKSDKDIEVVDSASNGLEGIEKIKKLKPDVVTLDIRLPDISGLDVLNEINNQKLYVPVIVISAFVKKESYEAIQSFEYGAFDVIEKPSGPVSLDLKKIKEKIIESVKMASKVDARKIFFKIRAKSNKPIINSKKKLLIIGASTGGPQSIFNVLSGLPGDLPIPVIIVQHMPGKFTKRFASRLNTYTNLRVKEAEEGEEIENGKAYLVPGDYNLELVEENKKVYVKLKKRVGNELNSINQVVSSATKIYNDKVLAVILTGMGDDGRMGVHELKRNGGEVICQDEKTCAVFGMSREIIKDRNADFILPLDKIGDKIIEILSKKS